jgi:hypothetical protein
MKQKRSLQQKIYLIWLILAIAVIVLAVLAAALLPYLASHNISSHAFSN